MGAHTRRFRLSAVGLGICGWLSACGGGGGGATTGPLIRDEEPATLATSYVNPRQVSLSNRWDGAPAATVAVGVVDTGFLVDHFEIRHRVLAAQEFAGTGTLADDVTPHGTAVAQVLAGQHVGLAGNARLLLAKAADASGKLGISAVSQGAQWAMGQGARVINLSLSPMFRHYGAPTDALYGQAAASDAVVVMAAGNGSENLSTAVAGYSDIFEGPYGSYRNLALVAGALNSTGQQLASYSAYPGENSALQSRFLVAPGSNPVQPRNATEPATQVQGPQASFSGTSSATAVVSAAAATVRAYWPHLTAPQTAQLLLDTADRDFSNLYALNTCGANGLTNCGYYTFGQGRLDMAAVLLPVGVASVPTGASVHGAAQPVAQTQLVLPAAFGDALVGQAVPAALFDSYGRDFGFNLLQRVSVSGGASLLSAGLADLSAAATAHDVSMPGNAGRWSAHLTQTRGDRLNAYEAPVRLVSLAGSGPLGRYGPVHGLGLQTPVGERWTFHWRGQHAQGGASGLAGRASALRQEAGLRWRTGPGSHVGVGYALTQERRALLGGTGSAGLGLDASVSHATLLQWQHTLAPGFSAFGQAELGRLRVRGHSLLTHIDGARTTQWTAGLAWERPHSRWALALSQPVRIEQARAHFDVPVGRTLDGGVIRQTRAVSLAPSGRQINLELAYQHQIDELTQWGFNTVWVKDFGHVAGQREWAVMARYSRRW